MSSALAGEEVCVGELEQSDLAVGGGFLMSAEGWDRRWVVVETGGSKARGVTSAKWSSQVTQ